jgi:hypothetical protein
MQPTAIDSKSKNHHNERVAFIQASWHKEIVDQSRKGFLAEMLEQGYQERATSTSLKSAVPSRSRCMPSCWPRPVAMQALWARHWWWTAASIATTSSRSQSSVA